MSPVSSGRGLWARSRASSSGLGCPDSAAPRKSRQTVGSNRPHTGEVAAPPVPDRAAPAFAAWKNVDAHSCLNGPGVAMGSSSAGVEGEVSVVTCWGKNASARSFQVIDATTASTRLSVAPSMRASAPP